MLEQLTGTDRSITSLETQAAIALARHFRKRAGLLAALALPGCAEDRGPATDDDAPSADAAAASDAGPYNGRPRCQSEDDCAYRAYRYSMCTDRDDAGWGICSNGHNYLECLEDRHCDDGRFCFEDGCVECLRDEHCPEGRYCGTVDPAYRKIRTCGPCTLDEHCAAPTPFCVYSGGGTDSRWACVECATDAHCPPDRPHCGYFQSEEWGFQFGCVECAVNDHCPPERPRCRRGGACFECNGPADCPAERPVCDAQWRCVEAS